MALVFVLVRNFVRFLSGGRLDSGRGSAPLRDFRRGCGGGSGRVRIRSTGVVVVRDVGGGEAGAKPAALIAEEAAVAVGQVLERHGFFQRGKIQKLSKSQETLSLEGDSPKVLREGKGFSEGSDVSGLDVA